MAEAGIPTNFIPSLDWLTWGYDLPVGSGWRELYCVRCTLDQNCQHRINVHCKKTVEEVNNQTGKR